MRALRSGLIYFAIVFCAGFALGTLRTLLVVPRVGARTAELLETPFMLVVSFVAARWVVRRSTPLPTQTVRLAIGSVALACMLLAEFALVLRLRGLTIGQYFANRDQVAGTVYDLSLLLMALMPLLVARR